jgi:hypothetical protein
MWEQLRVLVGCECSGRVRDAFAGQGWEAWSADLLPSESPVYYQVTGTATDGYETAFNPELNRNAKHYQGDVRDLFNWNHPLNENRSRTERQSSMYNPAPPLWDLFIGHPPCDHLSYAGARWFAAKQADGRQQAGAEFFTEMLNAPSPLVAVENPHSIMQKLCRPPDQVVQPWWFGDPFTKGIHLWLKGLPELSADCLVVPWGRVATGGGSWRTDRAAGKKAMSAYEDSEGRVNRAKVRSRTFPGLARAMAAQWGRFAEEYYHELGRY